MVRESQAPRVTQIQVRVDCNGCVQKIKKALNGIHGIHDLRVDLQRQKLTIIGWADPEQIVKAIKKTKKNATICSSIDLTSASKEPETKENAPAPEATQPPPAQSPQPQASPPSEPPPQQPPPEATPSQIPTRHSATRQWQDTGTEVEQVHVIHHHLPNYVDRFSSGHNHDEHWHKHHNGPVFLQAPSQFVYVTHRYNTHMPSSFVTEYEYVRSPSRYTHYNCIEDYSGDYQNGNVDIASMFSDDNPNACCIV